MTSSRWRSILFPLENVQYGQIQACIYEIWNSIQTFHMHFLPILLNAQKLVNYIDAQTTSACIQ